MFCRTRSDVEELAHALAGSGLDARPHHSALSRESREDAEESFRAASHGVLVATSTLELGIDIGDLDRVVQVDSPTTVASLLQRLGRTGRRGGPAKMTFVPTNPEQFALVAALLTLHKDSWVEPLTPAWRPFPILAQQILATVFQTNRIAPSLLVDRLTYASGIDAEIVVWISPEFREEHRSALDWLNNNTVADREFFGVQIEAWRIDNSCAAPSFKVVASPNDWQKGVRSGI